MHPIPSPSRLLSFSKRLGEAFCLARGRLAWPGCSSDSQSPSGALSQELHEMLELGWVNLRAFVPGAAGFNSFLV